MMVVAHSLSVEELNRYKKSFIHGCCVSVNEGFCYLRFFCFCGASGTISAPPCCFLSR